MGLKPAMPYWTVPASGAPLLSLLRKNQVAVLGSNAAGWAGKVEGTVRSSRHSSAGMKDRRERRWEVRAERTEGATMGVSPCMSGMVQGEPGPCLRAIGST